MLNFAEFAFGMDPTVSQHHNMIYEVDGDVSAPGLPILTESSGYNAVFTRRKDYAAAGLTYTVEFSCDLFEWTPDDTGMSVDSGDPSSGGYEAVKIPFPASVPLQAGGSDVPKFFRVQVSMN